ncbi:MAG: hypothetical protein HN413_15305 [Chloroflexi bacterium]|jgi:hypothetical protein|nr:hypothetical protein [Chloroflexota bacterium]
MSIPSTKPSNPPEEESAWEIERQTEAFLQKLMELNRKLQDKDKEGKLKLNDDLTGR